VESAPSRLGKIVVTAERGADTLIVIPTYNEAETVGTIVDQVRAAVPRADVLIVDDNSPDGTGDIADALAATDPRVRVLHRAQKSGLGDAYLAAFAWALQRPFDIVVEMDADGSHPASRLPALIAAVRPGGADLSIGSRWVAGGSVVDWPRARRWISRGGNVYAQLLLGVRVKDSTAGFRAFRADTLRAIELDNVASHGYCFQIDLTRRVHDRGLRITEVPIEFRERELGQSKMSSTIVLEAMSRVTLWGMQRLWYTLTRRGRRWLPNAEVRDAGSRTAGTPRKKSRKNRP
jgi:dolichol-phosphate mannosyltransferase